MGLRGIP
jgi:hypothetical protein